MPKNIPAFKYLLNSGLGEIFSAALILLFSWWTWGHMAQNDWGTIQATGKAALILFFSWVTLGVARFGGGESPKITHLGVIIICAGSIGVSAFVTAPNHVKRLPHIPHNDIGITTMECAAMFWKAGANPYADDSINPRQELPPGYRGFHYGPGMIISYATGAWGRIGYQVAQIFWVAIMLTGGIALTWRGVGIERYAGAAFFLAVVFSSEGWWKEYFRVGANDGAVIGLMALALILTRGGRWVAAGVISGFAFSTKFSPAIFLLLAMIRPSVPLKYWWGVMIGMIPLGVAVLASPFDAWRNIFLSRLFVQATPTSLHHILPDELDASIQVIALVAVLAVVWRGWRGGSRWSEMQVLIAVFTLTLIGILAHKEIHANHLTWLLFFGAVLLSYGRSSVWRWAGGGGGCGGEAKAVSSKNCAKTGERIA